VVKARLEKIERDVNARMPWVIKVVRAIHVFHINVVSVVPIGGPWFIVAKPIAAVLEAIISLDHSGAADAELVGIAKMGAIPVIRNASIVIAIVSVSMESVIATIACNLSRLSLSALSLLAALPSLCLPGLLSALRLPLSALSLPSMLRLLGVLSLLSFLAASTLCPLLFLLASALILLPFLCINRSRGSKNQSQRRGAYNFK
jgi:hypothetical protein